MTIQHVQTWLQDASRIVVLTGAGMSTESGLRDFRSNEGQWRQIDPLTVATVDAYANEYELFRDFYIARIEALAKVVPHVGHHIISSWQQQKEVFIATQNVDGLHQLAGAQQVAELHGTLRTARCGHCLLQAPIEQFVQKLPCACGGTLRPNVVLFGEHLPEDAWASTMKAIKRADIVFVIGTSLTVYPVNQLPSMTNGKLVYINNEYTNMTASCYTFDAVLQGQAGQVLQQLSHF